MYVCMCRPSLRRWIFRGKAQYSFTVGFPLRTLFTDGKLSIIHFHYGCLIRSVFISRYNISTKHALFSVGLLCMYVRTYVVETFENIRVYKGQITLYCVCNGRSKPVFREYFEIVVHCVYWVFLRTYVCMYVCFHECFWYAVKPVWLLYNIFDFLIERL